MEKKIIMINGAIDHGKDFLADLMLLDLKVMGISAEKISTAKAMKDITCNLFNISHSDLDLWKNDRTNIPLPDDSEFNLRLFLQRLGSELKDYFGITVWAKTLLKDIDNSKSDIIIVPDLRYPLEWDEVRKKYPVYSVNIKNDDIPIDHSHHSETSLFDFCFDYYIDNTGRPKTIVQESNKILSEILNG